MNACTPMTACCPVFSIAPGEVAPLRIDFGPWLESTGWPRISEVMSAALLDLALSPPAPANPAEIALVSGQTPDPPTPAPGFAVIRDGHIVEFLVEALATISVGRLFRLDVKVKAKDCESRAISTTDCISITVAEC